MATVYDKLIKYNANQRERQFRALLRKAHGAGKYRITRKGEVHAYGTMPNSNAVGWYLVGYRDAVERAYLM